LIAEDDDDDDEGGEPAAACVNTNKTIVSVVKMIFLRTALELRRAGKGSR
jgi:hypothetical protein